MPKVRDLLKATIGGNQGVFTCRAMAATALAIFNFVGEVHTPITFTPRYGCVTHTPSVALPSDNAALTYSPSNSASPNRSTLQFSLIVRCNDSSKPVVLFASISMEMRTSTPRRELNCSTISS